jgi:hypothetical protein
MQGHPTYYPTTRPTMNRQSWFTLALLVMFLLIGAGVGYLAARGSVYEATLDVQVTNERSTTQSIRIYVNDDQVGAVTVAPGATGSFAWRVGWTNTANGLFEVRAEPTQGFSDTDVVTVTAGQTFVVELRVR